MNSFMKTVKKSLELNIKQWIRNTSKIAVQLDENILNKIQHEEIKPKHHAGVMKFNYTALPPNIHKSLRRVVGDYPIKTLIADSVKLNHMISSRHPPMEDKEMKAKIRKIKDEIELKMPLEQLADMSEAESIKWKQRKEQLLQRRLKERTFAWKPSQYGEYESIVYALGRGALEFSVLMRILKEINIRDETFKPRSYLDFGSGVGTGMWAASTLWRDSIFEYFNIDSSRHMNELSELILREGNENQQLSLRNVFYRQFLPSLDTMYDLVICSYSLFELSSSENRLSVILNLWQKCDGYLVIVEEGTRRGFELVNEARNYILSLEEHKLVGHTFAPCPHDNNCPRILNSDDHTPCNFEIRYSPMNLKSNDNTAVSGKYSYVVLKKGLPEGNTQIWPRLVRPTLIRSKHAICRMCNSNGKLQEIIFTESKHGRPTYRCAKASCWGDRLPIKIGEPYETITKTTIIKAKNKQKDPELLKE